MPDKAMKSDVAGSEAQVYCKLLQAPMKGVPAGSLIVSRGPEEALSAWEDTEGVGVTDDTYLSLSDVLPQLKVDTLRAVDWLATVTGQAYVTPAIKYVVASGVDRGRLSVGIILKYLEEDKTWQPVGPESDGFVSLSLQTMSVRRTLQDSEYSSLLIPTESNNGHFENTSGCLNFMIDDYAEWKEREEIAACSESLSRD